MEIVYLGHSAFRLRGKDVTVVTDPFSSNLGLNMGRISADIVTVSHKSPNHADVAAVAGDPRVVNGPGEYEVKGVLISGVATAMEPVKGPINTAYVLRIEDVTVCHLGDISARLTREQVEEIGEVDVLLVPVGGANTLDPPAASQVIAQIEPSVVVPMHYRADGSTASELLPLDQFMRETGTKEFTAEPKLTVSRGSLGQQVKIVVLEPRRI